MKTRILSIVAIMVIACNCMAFTEELTTPQLGMPEAADAKQMDSVERLRGMMKRELTFIKGITGLLFWIQEFGGSTEDVVQFIELLKKSKLWDLTVEFRAFDKGNSAFSISHHAEGNRMRVIINTAQKGFSRERFSHLLKSDEGDATFFISHHLEEIEASYPDILEDIEDAGELMRERVASLAGGG